MSERLGKDPESSGYWKRLWSALLARKMPPMAAGPPQVEAARPDEQLAVARARIAALEMELAERDQQIDRMRSEYAVLQADKERASAGAGQEQLEKLFKRLAGSLGNLAVLTAMAEAGREIEVGDIVQLVKALGEELTRFGLEPVGKVGEQTLFDVACHQRMSGGTVGPGTPVIVQIPGYRLGQKILTKALVSARKDQPPQEQELGQGRD